MNNLSGWFSYRGITTQQHNDVSEKFKLLFNNVKPSQILEIGTSNGGLTVLLRDLLNELNFNNSKIRSYDISPEHNRTLMEKFISEGLDIDFRLKNIFNNAYDTLIEVEEVSSYIQQEGVTVVLCDGGSKKNEFNILAPLLKPGDIIMAHDYAPDPDYFSFFIKENIWNWHEIEDNDVKEAYDTYNLEPYLQKEFLDVVWLCRIKK